MIPKHGWKDMDSAPRDGTIIMVKSHMYNKPDQGLQVQPGHWFCDDKGKNWGWKRPWAPGWTVYASGWMTFEDFKQAQARETEPNLPMPDAKTPEFDL